MASTRSPEAERWKRNFGVRLRQLRKTSGISQMELAHTAGLDPTYISAVEQGRRNLSLVNIHALAIALDISPAEFFVVETPPEVSESSDS
ncbi:MAG: helix-turn-helix domain-containing protein [Pseudonocardiaceae bacterium]